MSSQGVLTTKWLKKIYPKSVASKVILFRILHVLTFCLPSVFLPTPSSIYFLSCSKRLCRLRPLWSQRTAHHHHQTGSRASNFHWLVPGLGSQDVGDRPTGQNPCPFLNPKLQALSLYLSSTSYCRFVLTLSVPKPMLSLLSG